MFELIVVLIPALPLLAAVANSLNGAFGERYPRIVQVRLAAASVFASLLGSVWCFVRVLDGESHEVVLYRWLWSGELSANFAFLVDPLSTVMMLVTTSISFIVTIFSINYMHNERGFARFFSVLPLFVASMLVLVMANNYVLLFLGWESVGVCSYLLINFYQDRPAAARAGTKAFVMNRVGDAGFLIGIFLMFNSFATTDYLSVFPRAAAIDSATATAICIFLTFGAIGKSAQVPLVTWLARAMEGPTPSSALIHAATMVTAGVYMITRSRALFAEAADALLFVAIVGAATALYGALVGLVQTDIKSILAYSTTTQLGLMFFACGLGAYAVAIFHLAAHAFFKTLLFLTAPSILHHLHGRADVRISGPAQQRVVPAAWLPLGAAAGLVAFPFLSIWWQTEIIGGVRRSALPALLAIGVMAMFVAAFAAGRMLHVAFAGESHDGGHRARDGVEMGKPLLFLILIVALALLFGVLPGGFPGTWFEQLVEPVATTSTELPGGSVVPTIVVLVLMVLLIFSGWATALYFDRFRPERPGLTFFRRRRLYNAVLNRFWLDDFYAVLVVRPVHALARVLERLDTDVIDWLAGARRRPERIRTAVQAWEERLLATESAGRGAPVPPAGGEGEDAGLLAWLSRVRAETTGHAEPLAAAREMKEPAWIGSHSETLLDVFMPVRREESRDRVQGIVQWIAEAAAAVSDKLERLVFHRVPGIVQWIAEAAAAVSDKLERMVFHTGVHVGMPRAGGTLARVMIRMEERLGQPWVIGFILAVWMLAILVGYGWS